MPILVMNAVYLEEIDAKTSLRVSGENDLVAAAKRGQASAFGELCNRHTKQLLRVTQRIMRNREDAEDAVQDSFLSAFVHLADFDERSRFSTWLTRIAINSALAKIRKKRGKIEVAIDEPDEAGAIKLQFELSDAAPNPEETYRRRERNEILGTAIRKLRPRARKVVEFHQLQEYSIKETAKLLGISAAAAKARMFHARAALRQMSILKRMNRQKWASAS